MLNRQRNHTSGPLNDIYVRYLNDNCNVIDLSRQCVLWAADKGADGPTVRKALKLRHAIALVSVGWYLMVPPPPSDRTADWSKLQRWTVYDSFDSAAECRKKLDQFIGEYESQLVGKTTSQGQQAYSLQLALGKCIASDDPRMAK
jgi:hypothetical protein